MTWPSPEAAAGWAEARGTPLYAYDAALARDRIREVRGAFEGRVEVWLALKANGCPALLSALARDLDGADVASEGELRTALGAGVPPDRIGFTGPGKTDAELSAAARAGVTVSVEAPGEIEALARAGGRAALLRLRPAERVHAFRVDTSGAPFGIANAELGAAMDRARRAGLTLRGIHVHAGSQCTSAAAWARHAVGALDLAARAAQAGLRLEVMNFGGGLGIVGEERIDVHALGRKLSSALRKFAAAHPGVRFVVEPGRYLLAEAGVFVARVVRRAGAAVVLDGGLEGFLFAVERFRDGPLPPVRNLTRPDAALERVRLLGPACTPLDTFGEAEIGAPEPGDLIGFGHAGAYGWSASPHAFLGRGPPAELVHAPEKGTGSFFPAP